MKPPKIIYLHYQDIGQLSPLWTDCPGAIERNGGAKYYHESEYELMKTLAIRFADALSNTVPLTVEGLSEQHEREIEDSYRLATKFLEKHKEG